MEIAVLGAGVAGAATAISLAERGHSVRVFERRPTAGDLGAGVVLWPNATFVLETLGLLEALLEIGGRPSAMRRASDRGELLGELDIGVLDRVMGYPSVSLLRRELQRVLLARLDELGVPIYYGRVGREIGERAGCAWLRFDDDSQIDAELLIGADGRMRSVARHYVHGDSEPVYQGFVNWVGTAEAPDGLVEDAAILDFWGIGLRFGIVPINRRQVYFAGAAAAALDAPDDAEDLQGVLRARFDGWPAPVQQVIAHAEGLRRIRIYDHDPISRWHRGRVLLIGDAAHAPLPTSGQGACQALEDAWHLAQCLPDNNVELSTALEAFTARRQAKTGSIIFAGRQFAHSLFQIDAEASQLRNEAARNADQLRGVTAMAAFWSQGLPLAVSPD